MISHRFLFVKLGFISVFALASRDCFVHLFKGGAPRTVARVKGRVALATAFLLLAFLCAYFVKEKRLNPFGIKTC